jgi:signal transduction histidine kinase
LQRLAEECAEHGALQAVFSPPVSIRAIRPLVQEEAFHIGAEAIRNACTHSKATRIEIELRFGPDLLLSVRDNGIGISPSIASLGRDGHFGLRGMRERASRIGAKFSLDTVLGQGTTVILCVPRTIAFETRADDDGSLISGARPMLRRVREFLGLR